MLKRVNSQKDRDAIMDEFRGGSTRVLITTDFKFKSIAVVGGADGTSPSKMIIRI
jgi:superfamily II DNA/RNA helicase